MGAAISVLVAARRPEVEAVVVDSSFATMRDVIADGDTISGPEGNEHWRCRHEDALVGPRRRVLDVDPGEPYAAGRRERG